MILLNSKRINDCVDDDEVETHNNEISDILSKVMTLDNYDCAVLSKYQDDAHAYKKTQIRAIQLHDINEVIEWGDIKNGVDLFSDENDEYLVIVAYGQSYCLQNGKWDQIVEAFKILPYDEERIFLNIVGFITKNKPVTDAINQF